MCTTLNGKDRILLLLYEHRDGLSYNQLRNFVHPNTKKKYMPELIEEKMVKVNHPIGLGGTKDVYILDSSGVKYVERNLDVEKMVKDVLELYEEHSEDGKLKILSKIVQKLFMVFLFKPDFEKSYPKLVKAIEKPVKEILNKKLFEFKRAIVDGIYDNDLLYYDTAFHVNQMYVKFIIEDSILAFRLKHYLNSHHIYFLTRLYEYSREEIEKENRNWLKGHDYEEMEEDTLFRINVFKKQFPKLAYMIPPDY